MNGTHAGGRPKGAKTTHRTHRGVFKKCPCATWTKCRHPWYGTFRSVYRFQLNKAADRLGVPRPTTPSEAVRVRFKVCERILDGTWDQPKAGEAPVAETRLTLREVANKYHEDCGTDPNRRAHRLPILKNSLAVLCRTEIDGQPFGDKPVEAITTADLEKFRSARRAKFRAEDARLAERRAKIANGDLEARKLAVPHELSHGRHGETGINRSLELLRKVMKWSIEHGHRHSESPFRKHGVPCFAFSKEQDRDRRLRDGEEDRLLAHAPFHLRAIIICWA
ncbi:MAG: hypothetical protein V1929_05835 [bacterium]